MAPGFFVFMAQRFDTATLRFDAKKGDDGAIRGVALITKTGVFPYRKADGTLQRELRHPREVFKKDSVESAKLRPMQVLHQKMITLDNAKALKVGSLGDGVTVDAPYITAPFVVDTADGLKAIEQDGMRELSMGYTCDEVKAPAGSVYDGQEYDVEQKNIKYNHCALVPAARLGSELRIKLDSADDFAEQVEVTERFDSLKGATMKIKLDNGIEYEAAPEVVVAFEALKGKADGLTTQVTALTAERDTEKGKAAGLQTKLDAAAADLPAQVQARVKLDAVAAKVLKKEDAEKLDGKTAAELKRAVVAAKHPTMDLKDKSDAYVDGLFDLVAKEATAKGDGTPSPIARQRLAATPIPAASTRGDATEKVDADESRRKMVARSQQAYLQPELAAAKA